MTVLLETRGRQMTVEGAYSHKLKAEYRILPRPPTIVCCYRSSRASHAGVLLCVILKFPEIMLLSKFLDMERWKMRPSWLELMFLVYGKILELWTVPNPISTTNLISRKWTRILAQSLHRMLTLESARWVIHRGDTSMFIVLCFALSCYLEI